MSEDVKSYLLAGSFVLAAAWMAGLVGYVVGMESMSATHRKYDAMRAAQP